MARYAFDSWDEDEDDRFEEDFFGRKKSKGYTYTNERSRISKWSDRFSTMSESFFGNSFHRKKNPLGPVLNVAKTMLKMVGEKPKVDGKFVYSSVAASNVVQLPMDIIIDKVKSTKDKIEYDLDPQKVDSFLGGVIENASLKRYQTNSEFVRTLQDRNSKNATAHSFLRNLLVTEKSDKAMTDDYPGYGRFIEKYKNHTFVENYEEVPVDPENPGAKLLDIATKLVRFPSVITEEELKTYEKEILEFKKIFEKYGSEIPETYEECDDLAKEMSQYIQLKEKEGEDESGEGDGDGKGSGADELAKSLTKSLFEKGEDEMSKKSIDDMSAAEKESENEDAEKNIEYDEAFRNLESTVVFEEVKDNKSAYMAVKNQIDMCKTSALKNLFKRKSRDQKFVMKSMKSGRFDTNKLAEAKQHVPTVYERVGEVKTDKIAVGLLIDESGSMGGSSIKMAQQAAIMLNEVFSNQPDIELFIYGHTADYTKTGATNILIYREPGKDKSKFALGSVKAKSNNRDGHAIFATGHRIRKFTKNPAILLVLSDGAPSAYGYNNGKNDTKEKVKKVEKLGFQVIQIAINNYVPSSEMFTHFVVMENIDTLPRDLVGYMSRKVNTLIKEHVTL